MFAEQQIDAACLGRAVSWRRVLYIFHVTVNEIVLQ